jgi:hypothetical protein
MSRGTNKVEELTAVSWALCSCLEYLLRVLTLLIIKVKDGHRINYSLLVICMLNESSRGQDHGIMAG